VIARAASKGGSPNRNNAPLNCRLCVIVSDNCRLKSLIVVLVLKSPNYGFSGEVRAVLAFKRDFSFPSWLVGPVLPSAFRLFAWIWRGCHFL